MSARSRNLNSVFYLDSYHPIQAGSIDGTDIVPHDNAVLRAQLCSSIGLYDPFGDPKASGDPYCTLFVGRLSRLTAEHTLLRVMSKYGRVKNLRLVRDIVTGASRGYAFVEFETEREMRRAYMDAHHAIVDDCEIIVDYNRQQLMPGWIPRRLGGGLSGKKESGQLRFGGREKPFRAPLKPIPYEELKKLGIPPPPEGRYMSRFEVPSPPRRDRNLSDKDDDSDRRGSNERHRAEGALKSSVDIREGYYKKSSSHREDHSYERSSVEKEHRYRSSAKTDKHGRSSSERSSRSHERSYSERSSRSHERSYSERSVHYHDRSSVEKEHHYRSFDESDKRGRSSSERSSRHHDRSSSEKDRYRSSAETDKCGRRSSSERSGRPHDRSSVEKEDRYRSSAETDKRGRSSSERSGRHHDRSSVEKEHHYRSSAETDKHERSSLERSDRYHDKSLAEKEHRSRSSAETDKRGKRSSTERKGYYHDRSSSEEEHGYQSSPETDKHSHKRKERDEHFHRQKKYSPYSPNED